MRIDCIIVEDEPLAMERTRSFVLKLPNLRLLSTFDSGLEALAFLQNHSVDLIFLDIQMDELSGIQLLELSKGKSEVIVTTAYQEYALKGYELNVTDYLLKPYSFDRFVQAVEKVKTKTAKAGAQAENKFIFIKTEYRLEKISLAEILFIEGMRDYRRFHCLNKQVMTLETFRELENDIPGHIICRVHKSFMVSIDKIESIEKDRVRIGQRYIPISASYKKKFFEFIQHPGN